MLPREKFSERRMIIETAAFSFALLMWVAPTAAHHHFAPQLTADGEEVVGVYDGTIDVYRLLNPHAILIVTVTNEDSIDEDWLIELSSGSTLSREGWADDLVASGDKATIAIGKSQTPNRGRLQAMLVHGKSASDPARWSLVYGGRGDTPLMNRLRERLPICGTIMPRYARSECFVVDADALTALEEDFPGKMGYIMP